MLDEVFLKRYRVLEGLLEAKYVGENRGGPSIVMEYLQDAESIPVRDRLNLCREVRNILSHSAELSGQPVLMPAEALLSMLDDIIDYVERPPLAIEFAVPQSQILWADMGQRVLEVMRAMEKRGFSHVPVLQKSELVGVFSVGVLLSYAIRDMGEKGINSETRVRDFSTHLPIDRHTQECYAFMDAKAAYADVKAAFERLKVDGKRLAMIFLTETGSQREPLLGMVTPWDVLRSKA